MPERPRILVLESLPVIGGGQKVLIDMLPALRALGDVAVLLPGEGLLSDHLRDRGLPCHFAPMGSYSLVYKSRADVLRYVARFPCLVWAAWRIIQKDQISLIYANCGRAFAWGTLAAHLAGRPIIWHHHNVLADRKSLALLHWMGHWRTVRRIIAASPTAAAQFPRLIDKTVTIPSGVDTRVFRPAAAARARVRNELGIDDVAIVVGMVGDLIPLKGQQLVLEAARLAPAELHYLIIGDVRPGDAESEAYAAQLRQMARRNTTFLGRRQDLPAVLNALDLLVVASEQETGPLALLEALASGVPAISTPVGRAPELLPPEALFPVGDAQALAEQLRVWLADSNKLRSAGLAARAAAEDRLGLDRFLDEVKVEIAQVLIGMTG